MRTILAIATLSLLSLVNVFAQTTAVCTLCGGVVADFTVVPPDAIPLLIEVTGENRAGAEAYLAQLSAAQKEKTTVVMTAKLDDVERQVGEIVSWIGAHGPFASVGVRFEGSDATNEGYALKRLAVMLEGRSLARDIVLPFRSMEHLEEIYETGAQAYYDQVLTSESVEAIAKWLVERDPVKRVFATTTLTHANPLYDIAAPLRDGATRSYLVTSNSDDLFRAVANLNRELAGDYAFDATASLQLLNPDGTKRSESALAFVRGEDLRTIVIPPGDATIATIISLDGDFFTKPRRVDARGAAAITDVGKKGGRFLIGLPPIKSGVAVTVDRPPVDTSKVTRETIEVATEKTIPVEEIVRRHQAYWSYQQTIQPRYVVRNETKLRFSISDAGDSVEATIAGDHFFDASSNKSDWVWENFLINGVRWKYGRIPELPLVQPEKVTQLPLDIHLSNEYRYTLAGSGKMRGFDVWEVRFEPPPNAPEGLPLYRGTVWIDKKTWTRVRIAMVQLNLSGEVLSNEERVDYLPFDPESKMLMSIDQSQKTAPRSILWLPSQINAQQTLSTAGRATVILRETSFTNYRIDPAEFDAMHQTASISNARMVRETERGLRYLEKTDSGERIVKEGFDTSRLFLVGGIHHDAGLEFPVVPLGGLDYFNFNLGGRGLQTNVFFAGVILLANVTDPSFLGTRTNVGADFFGLAVPFENTIYRGGEESESETIKSLPLSLTFRAGHPFAEFGKADVSLGLSHISYQRAEDTGADFIVPENTFQIVPSLNLRYDRWGYSLSTFVEHGVRTNWEPWGNLAEHDEEQDNFTRFGATLGKSFYLPRFQRIGIEMNYLDGSTLDRFSKYELGYFGPQRIRGIQSGSVRAERALLAHLSYGFVFSDQFRLEVFYDHGLIDDEASGYDREPFQGIGIGGQTIGPWGTLLRMDIGKTIGTNAQDDFVANVVFLKLFG